MRRYYKNGTSYFDRTGVTPQKEAFTTIENRDRQAAGPAYGMEGKTVGEVLDARKARESKLKSLQKESKK